MRAKTVRKLKLITLLIPVELLDEIDRKAGELGVSRSTLIRLAIREYLNKH